MRFVLPVWPLCRSETPFLYHFYIKTIILPRQARDKHRESTQKEGDHLRFLIEWMPNITIYDKLRVPQHLTPGDYVLGLRYDCEASAQVWNSCADIRIE